MYARQGLLLLLAGVLLWPLQGCYYLQAVGGQMEIWRRQQPLEKVIADPATSPALQRRLEMLGDARDFATRDMRLPDNGSYRQYADLGRDFVLWNVIAAPEFSLAPRTWCYLFVGCLAYRGYFDQQDAVRFAEGLRADGFDVHVGGVPAYSTLGRFDDPILNTMLSRTDAELIALLFHELAHQRLYIPDDTAFNESYASAVAEFGVSRYYAHVGQPDEFAAWQRGQSRLAAAMESIGNARAALAAVYSGDASEDAKRAEKARILAALERTLDEREDGAGWGAFNNARLAAFALYRGYLPAFRAMFADCESDWACFHATAESLADAAPEDRAAALDRWSAIARD